MARDMTSTRTEKEEEPAIIARPPPLRVSNRKDSDPLAHRVQLRSVVCGNVMDIYDDAPGARGTQGPGRQLLVACLRKRAPEGEPLYYPVEPDGQGGWRSASLRVWQAGIDRETGQPRMVQPPDDGDGRVWGPAQDATLRKYRGYQLYMDQQAQVRIDAAAKAAGVHPNGGAL